MWTCLAFLVRSCTVEGTRYPWDEYLLWNQVEGFRWLMHSNGHWTWLTPHRPPARCSSRFRLAKFGGQGFRGYQTVYATTEYVAGECYWQVRAGEMAQASEFVAPPKSINVDLTDTEATITLGVMVEAALLEKTFGLKTKLNPAVGIAPAQVNPFSRKASEAWTWTALWGGVLLALIMAFSMLGTTETYLPGRFSVPPGAAPGSPEAQRFSEPFEVKKSVPLEVKVVRARGSPTTGWACRSTWSTRRPTRSSPCTPSPATTRAPPTARAGPRAATTRRKSVDVVEAGTYVLRTTPSYEPSRAVDYDGDGEGRRWLGHGLPAVPLHPAAAGRRSITRCAPTASRPASGTTRCSSLRRA